MELTQVDLLWFLTRLTTGKELHISGHITVTFKLSELSRVDHVVTRPHGVLWSGYGNDEQTGGYRKTPYLLTYIERQYGKIWSFSGTDSAESWELNIEGLFLSHLNQSQVH